MRKKRAKIVVAENSPGTTGEGAFITDPHPAPLMKGAKMEKFTYPPAGEEIFNIPDCELEGVNSEAETAMIIVEKHFGTDPLECHENAEIHGPVPLAPALSAISKGEIDGRLT